MQIGSRLKEIRKLRGWKQYSVASDMHITQQTYSQLECDKGSPELDTLTHFCRIMDVQLHFLFSTDVPVTEENLSKYGNTTFTKLIASRRQLTDEIRTLEIRAAQIIGTDIAQYDGWQGYTAA